MFSLSKWYCDCVTAEGTAFIGYWAQLRWGAVRLPYAAVLYKPPGQPTRERTWLLPTKAPRETDEDLGWECTRLGVRASWTRLAPPMAHSLLTTRDGSITWRCHVPAGLARVDLDGQVPLHGMGYVEHLSMSLKPWSLPFHEVRWGRFLSPADHLVWIAWGGLMTRCWIFHNGVAVPGAELGVTGLRLPGDTARLELSDTATLRDGPLATALPPVIGAALALAGKLRGGHETKWIARGQLTAGSRQSVGWVIHETIRLK